MLEAIRRAISFLRQKQILHKLGVAVSVTVIGIACYVLYHMLRGIDVDEVLEAIKETEPRQIVLAGAVRGGRLFHADVLRPVRGARDRPRRHPLPHQCAGRLHQLFDRAQCRRQRLHRRRGALPDLFGVGTERDRRRQDLLSGRPDLLARQCRGAGARHRLSSGSGRRDRSAAALAQPAGRLRHHRWRWWPMWSGSGSGRGGSAAGPGPWCCRAAR